MISAPFCFRRLAFCCLETFNKATGHLDVCFKKNVLKGYFCMCLSLPPNKSIHPLNPYTRPCWFFSICMIGCWLQCWLENSGAQSAQVCLCFIGPCKLYRRFLPIVLSSGRTSLLVTFTRVVRWHAASSPGGAAVSRVISEVVRLRHK